VKVVIQETTVLSTVSTTGWFRNSQHIHKYKLDYCNAILNYQSNQACSQQHFIGQGNFIFGRGVQPPAKFSPLCVSHHKAGLITSPHPPLLVFGQK